MEEGGKGVPKVGRHATEHNEKFALEVGFAKVL